MKIAIAGKENQTENYKNYVKSISAAPLVTLDPKEILQCDALILPGGGDISPAFYGEDNHGSKNIDTELDILQLQALEACVKNSIPVLGICKGLQIINVYFGGTLFQDLPTSARHRYENGDKYHTTVTLKDSVLYRLYGPHPTVNSAHHQAVKKPGKGLSILQWCPEDNCIEALAHTSLPILALQWHPERIDEAKSKLSGGKVLSCFVSLLSSSHPSPRP